MKIYDFLDPTQNPNTSDFVFASGSFGIIDENTQYTRFNTDEGVRFEYVSEKVRIVCEFIKKKNGVFIRQDYFQNLTDAPIEIFRLVNRFKLDGNKYDVYTQFNGWQHESKGAWQPLVTQVRVGASGVRTCDSATPMMALHNRYTGKNTVFHIIPNAQWCITTKKVAKSDKELVIVETGFNDEGLHFTLSAGEQIELPSVIFFSADSKIDLDAYKLHSVYNKLYPRKALPVIYNTWLDCYDNLDFDELLPRIDLTAEMGFEGFMLDAGWFGSGKKSWGISVGDWIEQETGRLGGRLKDVSDYVREKGMIFGLWFEPERAYGDCNSVKEHPEYYIRVGNTEDYLLDFSNPDAVNYIYDVISSQIEKYNIGWVKFDFNATIPYDVSGTAFYRYTQGQKDFIIRLKEKYPNLYLTNCASGGYRMELGQGILFDSFWLSDNQGPYEGIRIVKDTLKRMPTSLIERWNVQKYCDGFPIYNGETPTIGRMINCNNATWDFLIGVNDSFAEAFLHGGPMGFSCNLGTFSEKYKLRWAEIIQQYKEHREFYKSAVARILVDTEQIIAIEYADPDWNKCIIQIFTKTVYAEELVIFPTVNTVAQYCYEGDIVEGKDIEKYGIIVNSLRDNCCVTLELKRQI